MSEIKQQNISAYNRNRDTALACFGLGSIVPVMLAAVAPVKYYMDMPDMPDAALAQNICIEEAWNGATKPDIDKQFIISEDIQNCASNKIKAAENARNTYIENESPLTRTDTTSILQTGLVSLVFWGCAAISGASNIRLRKQYPGIAQEAKAQRQKARQDSPSPV